MFFHFLLLIIILMIITIRIKIKFKDFEFSSQNKEHLNKNYKIEIAMYTFKFIPIFKIKITNKKIKKALSNEKIRKTINEQKIKIIENRKDIDTIKKIKNIKIEIDEMKLDIILGTEDAAITAFIIPVISTFIAIFLSKKVEKYNDKQIFSIKPIYTNQNLINVEFSGIIQIKMIHIINTICIVNKKRKGDKNERTSNRRSYDYGYE